MEHSDQSHRDFCKSAGRARALIGGAQFANYYKCTEAAHDHNLLEIVGTACGGWFTMNPPKGPVETTAQEKSDSDSEESQKPRDVATDTGHKVKKTYLPFSVESLMAKSSCSPARLGLGQDLVRTYFVEKTKVSVDSLSSVSDSLNDDNEELSDKEQSTWSNSSFTSPPRKCFSYLQSLLSLFV